MKRITDFICKHQKLVLIASCILLVLSFIGMHLTKVNYDILVYLPEDIETIKGQNLLTDDFEMGSYSLAVVNNMPSKDILELEEKIKEVDGVNEVASIYDAVGTNIPLDMLPEDIVSKVHKENSDLLIITFADSTSSTRTLNAVSEIREISKDVSQGGMSSMVLDTMNLSEKEIAIYVVIAVILCLLVLELALDSYIVPILLLLNIGFAIVFNLGSNIVFGEISYITKALVAVLQLGVTTDFSIFLYHSYQSKKKILTSKTTAMKEAIEETLSSVAGSSLTTIAGFLVLCTMQLTLGKDLGIVMAKGVLIGVICVLTLFPSLLLLFDNLIEKTKHRKLSLSFTTFNRFIIKHKVPVFILFLLLLIPTYLAYTKVPVYYKLDKSLPNTLESIKTNEILKNDYNIVSPIIILTDKNLLTSDVLEMTETLEETKGIEWVLSLSKLENTGITKNMLDDDLLKLVQNEDYQMILLNSQYETATDELNNQIDTINDIVKKYDTKAIVAGEGPLMKDLVNICDIDFQNVNVASIVCIFIILFFVLKSISLPFLLIIAIEFAIFTNMSFSYFSGTTLPFIAPIVLGTIQLGATIDYAILMTTTYLRKRREGKDKNTAMLETMDYCGTSILTSGMCFFAATFGVGIYSKIEMIGALCALIARGAIVSMLVVIMILPGVLLIFDKLIMQTTLKERKDKNMRKSFKKIATKVAVWVMLFGVVTYPIGTLALTKNETVYTKLNEDGSVKTVFVNNQILNTKKLTTLEDYSELENILNINDASTFKKDGNKLTWQTLGNDIFYEGTTNKKLPINLDITYKLDGKEKKVSEMLGQSGKVTITLKYTNNLKNTVTIDGKKETLYTPFIVTLGTILDSKVNSNVKINNGKVIANGTKNIVVGMSLPGLYESLKLDELKGMNEVTISYETTNFELASIYSVITPKLIDSDDLKIFTKMDSIYQNVDSLQENMNKIEEGAKEVSNGSNKLKEGLESSIKSLTTTSDALTTEQLNGIKKETTAKVKETFTKEYQDKIASDTWNEVKNMINTDESSKKEIEKYVTESVMNIMGAYLGGSENLNYYGACLQGNEMACGALTQNGINLENAKLLQDTITKQVTDTALKTSNFVAENVSKQVAISVSEKSALQTAENISQTLASEVANQVKDVSLNKIVSSLDTLYNGVSALDKGINDLYSGISTYNKEGTNKISELVNKEIKPLTNKIKALKKLSDSYNSFTTNYKLTNSETKFVMVVDSVKAPKKEVTTKVETPKTTFWDRVKNLFK